MDELDRPDHRHPCRLGAPGEPGVIAARIAAGLAEPSEKARATAVDLGHGLAGRDRAAALAHLRAAGAAIVHDPDPWIEALLLVALFGPPRGPRVLSRKRRRHAGTKVYRGKRSVVESMSVWIRCALTLALVEGVAESRCGKALPGSGGPPQAAVKAVAQDPAAYVGDSEAITVETVERVLRPRHKR